MQCKFLATLFAALLFGLAPVAAQPPPPGPDPMGDNLFPPELVMAHQHAIGLDEQQKKHIESEVLKAQGRFVELQWQLQEAMESLVGLVGQNRVDESRVMAQLDKVLGIEREIKRAQLGLMVRVKNELSPAQQARLRQLRPNPLLGGPAPPH